MWYKLYKLNTGYQFILGHKDYQIINVSPDWINCIFNNYKVQYYQKLFRLWLEKVVKKYIR